MSEPSFRTTVKAPFFQRAQIYVLQRLCIFAENKSLQQLSKLAHVLAWISWNLLRVRRRVVHHNLFLCLKNRDPKYQNSIALESFYHFILTNLEFLGSKTHFNTSFVEAEGVDHLVGALDREKGALIMCLHQGNWEMMCHYGSKKLVPVRIVAKDIGKGVVAQKINELRQLAGYQVIPRKTDTQAVFDIMRTLRKNEMVGFMVDQHRPSGLKSTLFGKPVKTNVGILQISAKTGAPIIPVSIKRQENLTHVMTFHPEFILEKEATDSLETNLEKNTVRMNALLEKLILASPEQYFWMHNRWKI